MKKNLFTKSILLSAMIISCNLMADTYVIKIPAEGVNAYHIDNISLTSSKTTFFENEAVTVSWNISGSIEKANLAGYGAITGNSGSVTYSPGKTTGITLEVYTGKDSPPQTKTINVITKPALIAGTLDSGINCLKIKQDSGTSVNGNYTVTLNNQAGQAVYCDMNTGGGGWMLLDDFGGDTYSTHVLGNYGINSLADLTYSGYDYNLNSVDSSHYYTNPSYMQMFFGGTTVGWMQRTLPNYANNVMVQLSNQWSSGFSPSTYQAIYINNTLLYVMGSGQGYTSFVKTNIAAGSILKITEYPSGLIWLDKIWVR